MADSPSKIATSSHPPHPSFFVSQPLDMPNPSIASDLALETASWKRRDHIHLGSIAIDGSQRSCVYQARLVTRTRQRVDFTLPAKSTQTSRGTARIRDVVD